MDNKKQVDEEISKLVEKYQILITLNQKIGEYWWEQKRKEQIQELNSLIQPIIKDLD